VQEINKLGKKARDGTISMDDMAGGTFTISNGGVYGSLLSTPIINPPQVRHSTLLADSQYGFDQEITKQSGLSCFSGLLILKWATALVSVTGFWA